MLYKLEQNSVIQLAIIRLLVIFRLKNGSEIDSNYQLITS